MRCIINPKNGITDKAVEKFLKDAGAQHVAVVASGFISADVDPTIMEDLEKMAYVAQKVKKAIN